jgi:hypothetical protein
VSPPVHENQLSKSNKLDAEAIWLYVNECQNPQIFRKTLRLFPEQSTLDGLKKCPN